jgi:UDP-2,3-diacylglucosamine pyrophosphatase LpxH
LHLGSDSAEADMIYRFLKDNDFDTIYLVGDVIDIWRLKKAGFLSRRKSQSHINVIQRLLKMSKKGTQIIYLIGNHDEFIANFIEDDSREFGINIEIAEKIEHVAADGKRYVVMHGHQFDLITRYNPWISKLGDSGYHFMLWLNKVYNWGRRKIGLRYWSLSKYVKVNVKKAVSFISRFEETAARYVEENECDGIICGHIHEPAIKDINGYKYLNCGCWTDIANCTALVELQDGTIELIQWTEDHHARSFYGSCEESGRDCSKEERHAICDQPYESGSDVSEDSLSGVCAGR